MLNLNLAKKMTPQSRRWAEQLLANWAVLNSGGPSVKVFTGYPQTLGECSISEVRRLLAVELETKRRMPILERLVTRYSSLEALENQAELMSQLAISVRGVP